MRDMTKEYAEKYRIYCFFKKYLINFVSVNFEV